MQEKRLAWPWKGSEWCPCSNKDPRSSALSGHIQFKSYSLLIPQCNVGQGRNFDSGSDSWLRDPFTCGCAFSRSSASSKGNTEQPKGNNLDSWSRNLVYCIVEALFIWGLVSTALTKCQMKTPKRKKKVHLNTGFFPATIVWIISLPALYVMSTPPGYYLSII